MSILRAATKSENNFGTYGARHTFVYVHLKLGTLYKLRNLNIQTNVAVLRARKLHTSFEKKIERRITRRFREREREKKEIGRGDLSQSRMRRP